MTGTGPKPGRFGDLGIRAVSGVVLGALCLFCVMIGGIPAMLLAAVLLVLLFWEYHRIITGNPRFATLPLLVAAFAFGLYPAPLLSRAAPAIEALTNMAKLGG